MAENEPLLGSNNGGEVVLAERESEATQTKTTRIVSLDVFRGLCVFLMILVDYAGSVFPSIAHSPWNGVRLADFVMPFFLFVVGVSVAIVNKIVLDRTGATMKVVIRTLKLFILGIFLQGGYLHGITGLTYGVDIERIRWMGILQRIAVGYIVAALCEVWLPCQEMKRFALFRNYICQWFIMFLLSAIHCGLLYGLYVPDWQFSVSQSTGSTIYEVKCSVRGDLGPACNSAGMIDRYILGIDHLYTKPVYRNMKECNGSNRDTVSESMPSWCHATFDPEGIVSSLTAAATSIIGLQYGHILVQFQVFITGEVEGMLQVSSNPTVLYYDLVPIRRLHHCYVLNCISGGCPKEFSYMSNLSIEVYLCLGTVIQLCLSARLLQYCI